MKKKLDKLILEQVETIKESILRRFDINKEFVDTIFSNILEKYDGIITSNYNLNNIYDNPVLVYKIILSICLNFEFDKDRLNDINLDEKYIENFSGRIVAQIIYSDLDELSFQMSNTINHPIILSLISLSNIIKYRSGYDNNVLRKKYHKDFAPIFTLLKEAMESLEGTLLLISNKSFSQAMTVYRLYLEQVITATALIKNFHLIDKYYEFQQLTIKYAKDTTDKDVLKLLEEKHIPARDVKSFLNYGWIEYLDGFSDLPKNRYSIKVMAKLCEMENIYELYSDSTNYVHMNLLFTNIDWPKEINKAIETIFATMLGIILNYKKFTNFDFVYKNIDLEAEISTIFSEFEKIISTNDYSFDVLRLKNA